ncbi:tyrosine-protein phosphatase 10D-like [Haliotis rubra]|uniref:tyrosine-protein phosphatase 10D-like n=1 Tax=Haliotis rubra TaxID=36100 RepID=UPI001EE5CD13|nr:tyrosine-protein phosphatase 10D-like [Haliotis rubra]
MTVFGFYLLVLLVVPGYRTCNASTPSTSPTTLTSPTTQPKQVYGGNCSTSQCDDDNNTVYCNSLVSRCLCVDGRYHNGQACISYTSLSPNLTDSSTLGTDNITVTWTAIDANNYTDIYHLNISEGGEVMQTKSTDQKTYTFVGLEEGTIYNVSLVRTITRYGRSQNLPSIRDDYRTKVGYNQTCTESDTCIDGDASCHGGRCRCDLGFYRRDTICVSIDELKPTFINVTVDNTTTMTTTWESPSPSVVTGYEVSVISDSIRNNFTVGKDSRTTTITELTPGREYNVSVETQIRYLQGRDEKTTGLSAEPTVMTPDTVGGLGDKTNLTAPDIVIDFLKADGDVESYLVQLQGITDESYNRTNGVTAPDTITTFSGVVPNYQYNLTITTLSNQHQSVPYTQIIRVRASQADHVEGFKTTALTSRTVAVSWKRPNKTNGDLFQYRLEVFNGTCKQQIVFNCTECKENVSMEAGGNCEDITSVPISESDINNPIYEVNYTVTGLLPDTEYDVTVAAYNQEGRGTDSRLSVSTEEEAASEPTAFTVNSTTSNSITVTWEPPVPRPGGTHYNISVYEKNENTSFYEYIDSTVLTGYDHTMYTVNTLSSFWEYKFYIQAFTMKGGSGNVSSGVVVTEESAPTEVVQFIITETQAVYNIQLSWECPKQKDGRNGKIISSTLIYYSNQTSMSNAKRGNMTYDNIDDCKWVEKVEVTPQFSYNFTVFLHNTFPGAQSGLQEFIKAGPPNINDCSVSGPTTSNSLTSVTLNIDGRCLHDDRNGKVTITGLLVCVNPPCDAARKRRTAAGLSYDDYTNWHTSKNGDFQEQYRTTADDWDSGLTDNHHFKYTVGEEQCLPDPSTHFCNGPLPEGSTLSVTAFACTEAGCAEGQPVDVKTKARDQVSADVGLIVGAAAAAVVCVTVIVLLIWFIRRGRNTGKGESHLSTEENNTGDLITRKRPVKISEFERRVDDMHKDSNLLFSEEFEDICALSPKHASKASETDGNRLRNRYVNILPFDYTRVKLRSLSDDDEDDADYINANYIPGKNSPREYIATQGPMTGTVADFWRMVWEQDVNVIIMLSDLLEKGKPKVDMYWPKTINEPVQHGEIIVEMINYSPLNKYIIKIFQIRKGDESRKVRHYFLPGWQDFGANLTPDNVISFVRDVRMTVTPTDTGPICVHCSAGVGRTGTYISLDVFKQAIDEENFDKELDVFDFVMKMRENRSYMVQTEKQYIFIHDTIKEMIIKKKKEIAQRDNIYQNCGNEPEENVYANQGYEPDPEELYMNVSSGQPTAVL